MACENKNCGSCDCGTPKQGKAIAMATKKAQPEVPDVMEPEATLYIEDDEADRVGFGTIFLAFMVAWFLSSC